MVRAGLGRRTGTVLQIWEVLSPGAQGACGRGPGLESAGWPEHSCHTRALAGAPAAEGPGRLVARSLSAQGALPVADWRVLFWREIWASHFRGCQMCMWLVHKLSLKWCVLITAFENSLLPLNWYVLFMHLKSEVGSTSTTAGRVCAHRCHGPCCAGETGVRGLPAPAACSHACGFWVCLVRNWRAQCVICNEMFHPT